MRLILTFLAIAFSIVELLAVPAYNKKIAIETSNGKTTYITLMGDENFHYGLSEDGYTLISDNDVWKYASLDVSNQLCLSQFELVCSEDESDELKEFKAKTPKDLTSNISPYNLQKAIGLPNLSRRNANNMLVGERRALVILMGYKDKPFTLRNSDYDQLFNEQGYSLNNATGSVRDFYEYASNGQLDYISDVYGPFVSQKNASYYGSNSLLGGSDEHPMELCIEALRCLPPGIDYSVYDGDGDGVLDNVHIIFAGYGEEAGASSTSIWSHEYPHRLATKNIIGYDLAGYSCTPEFSGRSGKQISNIGVVCHELGHALGAMDYYDTDYNTGGNYDGTGEWDVMAHGSWNNDGKTPPNFNPYVRTVNFGWSEATIINTNEVYELHSGSNHQVMKLLTESNGDYFLIENRQRTKFDAYIPGHGMVIYHIHPDISRLASKNSINSTHPQGCYPVCSYGSDVSKKNYGKINSALCPFPGERNITYFQNSDGSSKALAWNGQKSLFDLTNIRESGDGIISFSTGEGDENPDFPDPTDEMFATYHESFEYGMPNTFKLNGKDEVWQIFPNMESLALSQYIPKASDGKKILGIVTEKQSLGLNAQLSCSSISVEPGQQYHFCIDVQLGALLPTGNVISLALYDGNERIYESTIKNDPKVWNTIDIPFIPKHDTISFGINAQMRSGGFFIDDIKVLTSSTLVSTDELSIESSKDSPCFLLNGMCNSCHRQYLPKIIISNGKKMLR